MAGEPLTPVPDLLGRILDTVRPLPIVERRLLDAHGLVLAEDVVSSVALPGFDNSAMDGYAVRRVDVAAAAPERPVVLPVVGEIGAGRPGPEVIPPGTAVKIMTGAPVPRGCDAVVPYEWTDRGRERVLVHRAPDRGQHLRPAGEDVSIGDRVVRAGTVLGPRQLGLLAAIGRAAVPVRPRPRVVVLSTGSELRDPGSPLEPGCLYDANSFLVAASARDAGAEVHRVGIVPDRPEAFLAALEEHLPGADLVVTSGGVSQGDYDVVKAALSGLGTVWFGGVAMQPGKPQGFGVVGESRVPIFTLPGNPVSSYVSFEVFVLPAVREMTGRVPRRRPEARARLTRDLRSPLGKRQYVRGSWSESGAGGAVTPVGGHGSHLLANLATADALIVVPEAVESLAAGEEVSVLRLDVDF